MNENLKDKELMLYAPYSSYETEENVMSEMNLQGGTVAADYDLTAEEDFITGKDFIADGENFSEEATVGSADVANYDLAAEEDFITGKDFIADGILSSEEMNVENFENAGEYFDEEDENEQDPVVSCVTETDDYEFMPDISFDIYNAE